MVVALQNRSGSISDAELSKIAAIQQTISAIEDVIEDLDCEQSDVIFTASDKWVHSFPAFGRRRSNALGLSQH